MYRTLIAIAFMALLSACTSTAQKAPTATEPAPASKPSLGAPASATPVESEAARNARILKALAADSIYFDYDDFTIKPEYQAQLKNGYELLKSAPNLSLRIEGNADERGSAEYNIALGQKRAEAVRRALVLLGVPAARLEAISYGKEKPHALCHEESCWSQNRRVDFAGKSDGGK